MLITSKKIDERDGTMKQPQAAIEPTDAFFEQYEAKFKALADSKRLRIMHELTQRGSVCVCDLADVMGMAQSKLSYHLKILLDAELITRESDGVWNYYSLNHAEVNRLLSDELCCIFRRSGCC
jgi:ArsR family transcriptional regulator, arsenate/arsenite/antimonite-responsive transcriptional repressor